MELYLFVHHKLTFHRYTPKYYLNNIMYFNNGCTLSFLERIILLQGTLHSIPKSGSFQAIAPSASG